MQSRVAVLLLAVFCAVALATEVSVDAEALATTEAVNFVKSTLHEMNVESHESKSMVADIQRLVAEGNTGVAKLVEIINTLITRLQGFIDQQTKDTAAAKAAFDALITADNAVIADLTAQAKVQSDAAAAGTACAATNTKDAAAAAANAADLAGKITANQNQAVTLSAAGDTAEKDFQTKKAENDDLITLFQMIQAKVLANGFVEIKTALADAAAKSNSTESKMLIEMAAASMASADEEVIPTLIANENYGTAGPQRITGADDEDLRQMLIDLIAALQASQVAFIDGHAKDVANLQNTLTGLKTTSAAMDASRQAAVTLQNAKTDAATKCTADANTATNNGKDLAARIAARVEQDRLATLSQQNVQTTSDNKIAGWQKQIRCLQYILTLLTTGSTATIAKANTAIASVDIGAPVWVTGQWGACSTKCAAGTQTRTVTCQAAYAGSTRPCAGDAPATSQACNNGPCPVDCQGSWSGFSGCDRSCGGGSQVNTFRVAVAAANGGAQCPAQQTQTQSCNTQPCTRATSGVVGLPNNSGQCVDINAQGNIQQVCMTGGNPQDGGRFNLQTQACGVNGQLRAVGYNTGYPANGGGNDFFQFSWSSSGSNIHLCVVRQDPCCANGNWGQSLQLKWDATVA